MFCTIASHLICILCSTDRSLDPLLCSNWPRLFSANICAMSLRNIHTLQVLSCFLCFHFCRDVVACMLLPSAHQHATVWCRSPTIWCLGMAWTCDCSTSKSPASQFDGLTVLILCRHLCARILFEALCCVFEFNNMLSSMISAKGCLFLCSTFRLALLLS